MSFQPIIAITKIPRSSTAWYFQDITGNYPTNTTGFGASNAPANQAAITSLFGGIIPYAGTFSLATAVNGNIATEAEFVQTIPDGVNQMIVWYGLSKTKSWTLSGDRLTLTASGGGLTNILDSVDSLSDGTSAPIAVVSKTDTTVTLAAAWPGVVTTGTSFYVYYKATLTILTINTGYGKIVNEIAGLPYRADNYVKAMEALNDTFLYQSARYEFSNGNFSRAHEAALLLSYKIPPYTNNCQTC